MTPADLRAILARLTPDHLLRRAAVGFWLQGNGVQDVDKCLAYCEAQGLLCRVERNGVSKWYRDGPEPTVEPAPVVQPVCQVIAPKNSPPPKAKRALKPIPANPQLFR